MNEDEKADHDDALAHQRWVEQNDADPHRIHIDGLGQAETQRYLAWHRERRKALTRAHHEITQPDWEAGTPRRPLPLVTAAVAHHEQMIERLKAQLPDTARDNYQRPKPLKTTTSTSPQAADVVKYARLHGITVRQAATILARQGASR